MKNTSHPFRKGFYACRTRKLTKLVSSANRNEFLPYISKYSHFFEAMYIAHRLKAVFYFHLKPSRSYNPLAPKWSRGHPQFSSTVLCPELVVQFGSIAGLFATVLVRLIFSNCFSAYHGFVYLEDSKTCLFSYVVMWFSKRVADPVPLPSSDLRLHLFFLGFC